MGTSFIPDDVVFDEEPKEVATEVELTTYTPKMFTSSAAATSKVYSLTHSHTHTLTNTHTHTLTHAQTPTHALTPARTLTQT